MSHVWIVEARHQYGKGWTPVLGFRDYDPKMHIGGVYRIRHTARIAARRMFKENRHNHPRTGSISVRYHAAKYVRED